MLQGYKKLINDLNMHKNFREAANNEYTYNQRLFSKNTVMNTRSSINNKPINRIVDDLKYYEKMMFLEDENIKYLEAKIKAIDECIDNVGDINVKVKQLRALDLTQEEVAELVYRSPRQVQRIEKKIVNG